MVKTRPSPIDPDRDITAPNKFTIQIGLHRTLNDSHNMHTAYVYTPSGRCVGQMTIETLNKLKLQHHMPLSTGKARATTMEEDTAKLMATYDTKKRKGMRQNPDMAAAPDHLMRSLAALGIRHERFASPLDRSPHMRSYNSASPADRVFGATGDAFSCIWNEAAFAHPGRNHDTMEKSVRWAITSATLSDEPVMNILLLPDEPGSKFNTYMSHPSVQKIATINNLQLRDTYFWRSANEATKNHRAKTPYNLWVISNQEGMHKYINNNPHWEDFATLLSSTMRVTTMKPTHTEKRHDLTIKPPRALMRLITEQLDSTTPVSPPTEPTLLPSIPAPVVHNATPYTLCSREEDAVYTDGSCITQEGKNTLGAAIWHKRRGHAITVHIQPNAVGATSTANMAELTSIKHALTLRSVAEASESITIYTDSLTSIHQIHNAMHRPALMHSSKYREMLLSIVEALKVRAMAGGSTTLQKIKSHSDIQGNEHADRAAVKTAKAETETGDTLIRDDSHNIPYQTIAWPAHPAGPNDQHPDYFTNSTAAIKTHLMTQLQAGRSNRSLFVELNEEANKLAHKKHSNYMWEPSSRTPALTVRRTWMLRWGLTFTNQTACRWKIKRNGVAATTTCPLCPGQDGCSHMFGGCQHPNMKAHYISRHNRAARMLFDAIQRGNLGGFFLYMGCEQV